MASLVTPSDRQTLASRSVKDVYPVSRLVREARVLLEGSFPLLWVEGEISNLAMPGSGHIYFTLKDAAAQVRCAMFRNRNQHLRFTPENGMQVLLRVRVTLYEGRGEFQLVVEHMEEAGSGALQRAYEALKQRLGLEGLFDAAHKKPLPAFPQTVGIVSSPDGAAVHDIVSVFRRRAPSIRLIIYPVAVQGQGAAAQIAQAIQTADARQECDVLIVGRGGGSLEDLWSFNEELVARAVFACQIPIISAVGHEIDYSIADFVADVRAPTPSAAAELAAPETRQLLQAVQTSVNRMHRYLLQTLQQQYRQLSFLKARLPKPASRLQQHQKELHRLKQQLQNAWRNQLQQRQQQLDFQSARLKHPRSMLALQQQRLKHCQSRLQSQIHWLIQQHQHNSGQLSQRLQRCLPVNELESHKQHCNQLGKQLHAGFVLSLKQREQRLIQQMRTLAAVSPLNTLDRGYSITQDAGSQRVITDAAEVNSGDRLDIRLSRGELHCQVISSRPKQS